MTMAYPVTMTTRLQLAIHSLLALLLAMLPAMSGHADSGILRVLPCDSPAFATACDLRNPEDLAWLPLTGEILFSQFGGVRTGQSGTIGALDPHTMQSHELPVIFDSRENWGNRGCLAQQRLDPHGIDISRRRDGRWQLLVVNHYRRESVEFFELTNTSGKTQLLWRGCVAGDRSSYFNDVAALPSTGGFVVSQMMPSRTTWQGQIAMLKALAGWNTGYAQEWQPDNGTLAKVPNSDAALANGILVSADEKVIYLNSYFSNEVIAINRVTGAREIIARISHPDNSSWTSDGRMIVASHRGSTLQVVSCDIKTGDRNCVVPFAIIAINPETRKADMLFRHNEQQIPLATTGLLVNRELFLGTYSGNRITRIWLPR